MKKFYSHAALFEKGIAVGYADIKNDAVIYYFRDERFEVPTRIAGSLKWLSEGREDCPPFGWNGYFYTAPIEELRKIKNGLQREDARI